MAESTGSTGRAGRVHYATPEQEDRRYQAAKRFAALIEERSDLVERLGEIDSAMLELEDVIAEPLDLSNL